MKDVSLKIEDLSPLHISGLFKHILFGSYVKTCLIPSRHLLRNYRDFHTLKLSIINSIIYKLIIKHSRYEEIDLSSVNYSRVFNRK